MNEKRPTTQEGYTAPVLELHEFGVERGFANSNDYLEIKGGDYTEGPGLDGGYNDLEF